MIHADIAENLATKIEFSDLENDCFLELEKYFDKKIIDGIEYSTIIDISNVIMEDILRKFGIPNRRRDIIYEKLLSSYKNNDWSIKYEDSYYTLIHKKYVNTK